MISFLDSIRAKLLKRSLKSAPLHTLFYSRSKRILFLSLAAIAIYLPLSLYFPLWVLLIGPVIWGVPHLISSVRYATPNLNSKDQNSSLLKLHVSAWIIVFLYRFSIDVLQLELPLSSSPLLFEFFTLISVYLIQVFALRKYSMRSLFYLSIFCVLTYLTYLSPLIIAACLLIGHNFVGLFYWNNNCRTKQDYISFVIFSTAFGLVSLGMITGQFDFMFKFFQAQPGVGFLNWNYTDLISSFTGEDYDYKFWYRFICLYAFTQALHYFIWLKAIPELKQPDEHPPSFRWTFNKLSSDFGSSSVLALLSLILVSTCAWFIYEYQIARLFYLALASYHGFMEIAGLAFLRKSKDS